MSVELNASGMARVPIIAVTGTNGKTTTARMIAHIMRVGGHNVGLTTTDGAYLNGVQIASGDMAGPRSAREILDDPRVDFAVLETARGGILRSGLAFACCDVGVVTNVAEDHLGLKGVETIEDLARVKARVPSSVCPGGASVLNADNRWTVDMARVARGEIIFFSLDPENPVVLGHTTAGGRAVALRQSDEGEVIALVDGDRDMCIASVGEIPATMEGRVRINIANALAACAAVMGIGVPPELIRDALSRFTSDFDQTPGRFNLVRVGGRQVLLDYAHNPDGMAAVADFVRRTHAPHSIGIIGMAGDRREEDFRAFGELAGRTFDRIVIREHDDLRGREPGEVARILESAVRAAGKEPDRIKVVLDEEAAIRTGIEWAEPGDLVVALVYRVERAWEIVLAMNADPASGSADHHSEVGA
jgi:cyanophycin synthetase